MEFFNQQFLINSSVGISHKPDKQTQEQLNNSKTNEGIQEIHEFNKM